MAFYSLEQYKSAFCNLKVNGFEETSPPTLRYNCIAWAAGVDDKWWQDDEGENYEWPGPERLDQAMRGLVLLFKSRGFQVCDDGDLEPGVQKVALYTDDTGKWTHAARQREDGRWTTKDGNSTDFTHASPECLCPHYGRVYGYMQKSTTNSTS